MNLFDPTVNLVPQSPKPRTTGIVSASLGDSLYTVTLAGEAITMRSAGGNTLSVGTEVSVIWAGGDMPWCCAATAGYRSLVPVPLADFASSKPGSVLMAYLMKDNPRNYAYRQGISLGEESEYQLNVAGPDGEMTLPVEYAGRQVPASLLPPGGEVLLHQVDPGRWIVIGRPGESFDNFFEFRSQAIYESVDLSTELQIVWAWVYKETIVTQSGTPPTLPYTADQTIDGAFIWEYSINESGISSDVQDFKPGAILDGVSHGGPPTSDPQEAGAGALYVDEVGYGITIGIPSYVP